MSSSQVLDDAQQEVAACPVEGRQMVTAGPGAGKTEVVGSLIQSLLNDDVAPGEILLLSFSRSALAATRKRVDSMGDDGQDFDITTIDSLAARILLDSDHDLPRRLGFDASVRNATKVLASGEVPALDDVRHIVLDEAQDVVGIRSDFILTLLGELVGRGSGFTILGDPLQAIYDFQTPGDIVAGQDLLGEVRRRFHPNERTLTGEYRARNDYARSAVRIRPHLMSMDSTERLHRLRKATVDVPPLGHLDADGVADIETWSGTTAMLCDTNIRAALAADRVNELGLRVELTPHRDDPSLPAWIGALLQDYDHATISRSDFDRLAAADQHDRRLDHWRLLLELSRARRDVSIRSLADALQSIVRSRTAERGAECNVLASTVHRAKGLEFDNVVLVDPDDWTRPDDPADAASRRLFVALTRARDRITRVRGIDTRGWHRKPEPVGPAVWIQRQPRRGGIGPCTGILLEPWMARSLGPSQANLNSYVGSAVSWRRSDEHLTVDGDVLPSWTAHTTDGDAVAQTGETFGRIVADLTDRTLIRLPQLVGGHVEGLETVAGPPQSALLRGQHGLWVGARLRGALKFTWELEG